MSRFDLTSRIAYQLYVHRGYVHGGHREDWSLAEQIVEACFAAAQPKKRTKAKPRRANQPLSSSKEEQRALEALSTAVEEQGRAAVAGQLGYGSTSSVGRLLRGDRALTDELAQRILKAFAPRESALRVLPGRAVA